MFGRKGKVVTGIYGLVTMKIRQMVDSKRIEWADYYKAFAILLVVIGHATGRFNGYIYQFHVAAFFFISGYLSQINKKSYDQIIIVKFFNLILPYIFYGICGLSLFAILQRNHLLQYVSSWKSIPAWSENVRNMFRGLYCDWLGATWFLLSLFAAYILAKICLVLDKNKAGIVYVIVAFFLYSMGYYYHNTGTNATYLSSFAHYFVIQFYFSVGHFYRRWEYDLKNKIKIIVLSILLVINIFLFLWFRKNGLAMDLASTTINTPLVDLLMAGNGICFLICISKLLELVNIKKIKSVFEYIGRNTFGILIYHFFGFKLASLILSAFGVCDWMVISNLCPPPEISNIWWFIYLIVAVSFSMLVWFLTSKIGVIRFLSGTDSKRYNQIYKKYEDIVR